MITTEQCECCNECQRLTFYGCPDELAVNVIGEHSQVFARIESLSTGRTVILQADEVSYSYGQITFDLQPLKWANNLTYKVIFYNQDNEIVEFYMGENTYNCLDFKLINVW